MIGALLLSVSLWVVIVKRDFESVHDVPTSPPVLAIVVGGIMITTALLGLIGSAASCLWPARIVSNYLAFAVLSLMQSFFSVKMPIVIGWL